MSGVSTDLYAKITDLKKQNPDAKIYVSVGGWTFSDNGSVSLSGLTRSRFEALGRESDN